ncbi:S-layer homology domain-containing protein [Quadrisphaera sp. GCM10027208]|uniref:CAP and S-layer homology domain-containing protein n=1 Tax=Quadrisphaera sp. GCM10027208 TaxID=3273423 RepID=UPI00361DAEA5
MRRALLTLGLLALSAGAFTGPAAAVEPREPQAACPAEAADPWFWDVPPSSAFADEVGCARYWQVAEGRQNGSYGPLDSVRRGEMATFVLRAIEKSGGTVPAATKDWFSDDATSPHRGSLDRLAELGVIRGGGDGTVRPNDRISRVEMAVMLVRAHDLRAAQAGRDPLPPAPDAFVDDDHLPLSGDIDRAAAAGIVGGTSGTTFAPGDDVRRDHMAAFLTRLLDVHVTDGVADVPPPPPPAPRPVAPAPVAQSTSVLTAMEQHVLDEINAYRASKGLRTLVADPCLTEAARTWSAKLSGDGALSHSKPTCPFTSWAENVAYHYDYTQLFEAWRDSPGHDANILRAKATKMGVGIVAVPGPNGVGTRYYATTQSD